MADRKKIKLPKPAKPVKKPQPEQGTAEQSSADRPRDTIKLRDGFTLPKSWR
ncbi:hypothetical protein OH723_31905 (plasmid) [Streptomyces albidoflavus]|uniref:hypothetical protein n=1 Tax=Streptomyces TaxID=1883 RepID=UPI000A5799E4|nr:MULTISPECIES: hypothetical protein [unclassified Streptomyces]WTC39971.1 hypothetical protein OH723_31905 [Streptomyces albidoflavus]MBT2876420.1 hypothetical protein [Streptomyces sp. McG6]MBT2883058.1 hypothetical protein [Streptomyces sp. McG5]MBT2889233.1 hypothetical protein [Streptomyces sp. McG2]WAD00481.1 hypothetical protein OSU72_30370 [Streptomyces sp. NA13]